MDKVLLFDLVATQPDIFSKRHGGGKYGEAVLRSIIERNFPLVCYYDSSRWLNPSIKTLLDRHRISLLDIKGKTLSEIVKLSSATCLYSAQVSPSILSLREVDIYCTIHGLRRLETPLDSDMIHYLPLKNFFRFVFYRICRKRRIKNELIYLNDLLNKDNIHVITVSNHSASLFKCFLSSARDKDIPVFYSPPSSSIEVTETKYRERYFLLVSANRYVKNSLRALRAFDRLFSMGYLNGFKVKITGATSWKSFLFQPENHDRFEFYGYVDEPELEQLYHDSYCFVYPSLNEGFGYPPLESMHYGVPVIASSFSSIPEICGDAVMYFNPLSIEEIMSRIILITNEDYRIIYSQKAKSRYEVILKKQRDDLTAMVNYIFR